MHLGLIGGIGPAATEFYYRRLVDVHTDADQPLELTIANAHMPTLVANLADTDTAAQAAIYANHLNQLHRAGAQVAAITSIAGHFCFDATQAISPLPLVSAISALRDHVVAKGYQRIGLLGSGIAMKTSVYGSLADRHIVLPSDPDAVGAAYMEMAAKRHASSHHQDLFFTAGNQMVTSHGAEVIILVGTDLFLAFENADVVFPYIDSAEVHIAALAALAIPPA
jgi:aspartate racemase